MSLLQDRIAAAVARHGSYRAAGRVLMVSPSYLCRLATGEKDDPSPALLRKLKLRRVVTFEPAESTPASTGGEHGTS